MLDSDPLGGRAKSVADEFGRPPPSGSKPSGGSRAIARRRLPRDRAADGVSSHSGNARYRGARRTVDDSPSSLAPAASTSWRGARVECPPLCSARSELTPSRACVFAFLGLSEFLSLVAPQFPLTGHIDRATSSVGLCAHKQDDFGPPPRRPSTPCRSRRRLVLITCPLRPSPADQCATVRQPSP